MYLSLGILRHTPKLQEKLSVLNKEHPALQNMKFLHCFLVLWAIFACWIRIRIKPSKTNAYPDPRH
jgi:hypothetical protein